MASLSSLSKFLGVYQYWKEIIKNSGLTWEKRTALETFMSILDDNIDDILEWLRNVVKKLPKEYSTVLVFTTLTGLRPTEGCEFLYTETTSS